MNDVTQILAGMRAGNRKEATERLVPLIYDQLRARAKAQLSHERPDHSLQATALVHEAYLRLLGGDQPPYRGDKRRLRQLARRGESVSHRC